MNYDYIHTEARRKEAMQWLKDAFTQLQVGRITTSLIDSVFIDIYGKKQPIAHLASITVEGMHTLCITPWDATTLNAIEEGLRNSNLQATISVGETSIRVSVPTLTSERREEVKKIVKAKAEEAQQSLRQSREKDLNIVRNAELSEDEKRKAETNLQKLVDEIKKELKALTERKLQELTL